MQPILATQCGLRNSCGTNLPGRLQECRVPGPVPSPLNWNLIRLRLPGASMPTKGPGLGCSEEAARAHTEGGSSSGHLEQRQCPSGALLGHSPLGQLSSSNHPQKRGYTLSQSGFLTGNIHGTLRLRTNYKGEGSTGSNLGGIHPLISYSPLPRTSGQRPERGPGGANSSHLTCSPPAPAHEDALPNLGVFSYY